MGVSGRFVGPGDISGLFPGGDKPFGLIQGQLTSWNGTTLANTVHVLGQPRVNLAVCASSVAGLAAGDTVLLAPFGTTYIIIDKIRVP